MGMFGFDNQFAMFDVTPLENQFILEYMPSARGEFVKVYLYGLMQCYHPQEDMSITQMSHELNLDEDEILAAYRHWERMGLVQRVSDNPPAFRYVNVRRHFFLDDHTAVDADYVAFSESLYAVFNNERNLHTREIALAYEWVADLGLPTEVVLMLMRHMIRIRGRNFSMQSASKLAAELAEQKVSTIEEAEMVLDRDAQVWKGSKALLRRLGKRRDPSKDEQDMYLKWIRDWGFSPDAIEAACVETTKGEPTYAYLNGILQGMMNRQGRALTSEAQVEKAREADAKRTAPLRNVLSKLRIHGLTINEGTLAIYDDMLAMYPDEVIQAAAREVSMTGGNLQDVVERLTDWKEAGLADLEEINAFRNSRRNSDYVLRRLYKAWGTRTRPNPIDRETLGRWMDEGGIPSETVLFCARYASGKDAPMKYLDKLFDAFIRQGIRTPEQAAEAHKAWQEKQGQPAVRPGKTVSEAQYTQREYTHSEDPLDQMMAEWKENAGNA